jgi:hypothetical protein
VPDKNSKNEKTNKPIKLKSNPEANNGEVTQPNAWDRNSVDTHSSLDNFL